MQQFLTRTLLLAIVLPALTVVSRAQILMPFNSNEGARAALQKAKDSIGADAHLTFVATFGNLSQGPLSLEFDLNEGAATAWAYSFHSSSAAKTATIFVVKLPLIGFNTQSLGQAVPIPAQFDNALDTSGAYAGSSAMIGVLKEDTAFQRYRAELPGAKPGLITLGQLVQVDSVSLPNGFPLDQPTWTVLFNGGGDSTMTCFVASRTGEHFCRRIMLPVLGTPVDERLSSAGMDVFPNPATGRTVIAVRPPNAARAPASVMLYDERGAMVLDLTASFNRSAHAYAEFDAATLPAGVYYCRAQGSGFSGTIGVVVGR